MEILVAIYWISVAICLWGVWSSKTSEGKIDYVNIFCGSVIAFFPLINVFMAIIFVKDYRDKPWRIRKFREDITKIRELILSNQVPPANNVFSTLRCPSNEFSGEYDKIKIEVDIAMMRYTEEKRKLDEEEKKQREIRGQERKRQQEEEERQERERIAMLVQSGQILDSISHQEFELIILEAFSRRGYKTTHTSFSGDEGVDGFIEKDNTKIAIQCKKYNGSIGQPAIRDFYGAMMHFNCEEGIFITTSDFSAHAKAFVKNKKIQLFDRQKTMNLLQSTINNDHLVQDIKKRQLEVVIGHCEDGIDESISVCVKKVIKNKYDLKVRSFSYGEELLEQAENGVVDIFILILNNIRFRRFHPPQERVQNSVQLITQIKTIYRGPVIALTGLRDPTLAMRSKLAGSDFFLPIPFEQDAFMEAIEKCLDMLPGFDEVSRKKRNESTEHIIT